MPRPLSKRIRLYTCCLLLFSIWGNALSLHAQSITGRITDDKSIPIEFANVVALNPADSTIAGGGISARTGEFTISHIPQGKYVLQVSYIGYITRQIDVWAGNAGRADVGDIVLETDSNLLNEVEVSASLSPFSRSETGLVARVSSSLLSSAGTANDVIKQFPGVSVKDKAITVFGKDSPVIYINNRKVYDEGELDRLQSSEISTIELITAPGAKYDAEGRAVLLIKTKRNEENGVAVRVSEQLAYSKYLIAMEDIGVVYTHNNLSVFASYNNLYLKQSRNPHAVYTVHADTVWTQYQDIPQVYKYNTSRLTTGFDWSVSPRHSAGAQYQGYFSSDRVTSSPTTNDVLANGELYDQISTELYSKAKPERHLLNAFYRGEFGGSFALQMDMDYMKSHSKADQQITETSSGDSRNVTLRSRSDFELIASKLLMEQKLGEAGKLEFGGEYSHIYGSGFLSNPEKYIEENNYTNKEEKAAGFVIYAHRLGKWNLRAGIRYEYAHSLSTEDSTKHITTDRYDHNFYPDVSLSGEVGDTRMNLSMSRKTKRPSFDMLNSNNYYINRFLTQKGNPYLKNEDIYAVDYSLVYNTFDFTLGYTYKKNPIAFSLENVEGNASQTIMTFENFAKYREINALLGYQFGYKIWQAQLSAGIKFPFFSINYLGDRQDRNRASANIGFYNQITLPGEFILSANYDYQGRSNNYIEEFGDYHNLSLGIRKSFFEDRLSVNLQGEDVFGWITDRTEMRVNNISYIQRSTFETRYIILTISYQINNYKKKYRGGSAAEEEIHRLQ